MHPHFNMKQYLTLLLFLTFQSLSPAQVPRMTTRDTDGTVKRLHLDQADVSIRVLGDIAETSFDLRFRNDGERPVEGEFVMPLPDGATVSGYALEVNGKLRDSVAVEKERARNAYESIKRRMIDPGLVEREAGNIYRTKVFPVPAKGTKRLRISYTETLRTTPDGFAYSLPLDFPEKLDTFSCKIHGPADNPLSVAEAAGISFAEDCVGDLSAELKNAQPTGTLKLLATPPAEPLLIVEDGPQPEFYLTADMPALDHAPRPAPATVMLVWDASLSGLGRDHAKEFAVLDLWFAKLGKTRVHLQLLRDRIEDGGVFDVRDGQWTKLKQTLQQLDYDGATSLLALQVPGPKPDLVVYVGDGVATLGSGPPEIDVPFVFIHSGVPGTMDSLAHRARRTGGEVIDLTTDTPQTALARLTQLPLPITLEGAGPTSILIDQDLRPGQRLRYFGTLPERHSGKLLLHFGAGENHTMRDVVSQRDVHPAGIIRRLYAQRVLADLEHQDHPDHPKIIEHCKTFGLVSDYTSLIVLERLDDYAQYHIPPPEPELQPEYQRLVAMYHQNSGTNLSGAWSAKLQWYRHQFPDYDALILPRLKQVSIWKNAIESLFTPAQRDPEAFATIAGWYNKATGLISERTKLLTKEDYQKWKSSIDEVDAQGRKLAQTPLHPPPAGQPLTVSVRGYVVNPGLVTGDSGMTLRQAITKTDGQSPLANLDYVALYRNAGKTVYNTLSQKYQDIPLFPGDMIVVDQPQPNGDCFADPFAAAPKASSDPAKQEPIRTQQDLWTGSPANNFSAAGAGGAAEPPASQTADVSNQWLAKHLSNTAVEIAPFESTTAAMAEFAKAIAAGADARTAYRTLVGKRAHMPRFYPEAARVLFAKHHDALATRVLSNLVESSPGDVSALRSYAFWLAEFGQSAAAEEVLKSLPGDDLLKAMDIASIRGTRRDLAGAAEVLSQHLIPVTQGESGNLAAIALTKYNVLYHFLNDQHFPRVDLFPQILTTDIRISLTSSAGDDASLQFEVVEPGGQPCSIFSSPSLFGGRITGANGVREYMIRHAMPGTYQIRCATTRPTTVRTVIHTHWGRKDQQTKVVTLWLDPDMFLQIGEIQYEFEPMGNRSEGPGVAGDVGETDSHPSR